MIDALIHFSVKHKLAVGLLLIGLIGWGSYALTQLPIDAVPDITNNQVQVVTVSSSLAPQEVEQYITFPVELAMANLPDVQEVRSVSKFGLSVVTIVFDPDRPLLEARQLVNEQIDAAAADIPPGLGTPTMMPITTGLGEIYQYTLQAEPGYQDQYDPTELRSIQDWIVKRYLAGIDGIVEISSFGGYVKQYEVAVDPLRLRNYQLSIDDVYQALAANNANVGGSYIEQGANAFYIRSEGMVRSEEEIGDILITQRGELPVRIADVATVGIGHPPRFGAMTANGQGEAVGGITLMLKGANSSQVIERVKDRIAEVQQSLPEGLRIEPYLDRSELVSRAISTVRNNLVEGGLIVIFVLVLLLGNVRGGLIVASVIPLAMMFAFGMMHVFGVSANLMSLGAIDFGLIVDGAVIVVEGVVHRLQQKFSGQQLSRTRMDEEVVRSSSRIMRSAVFGEVIILMVYLPILALEGVEGKMFIPMAQTVSFAILGALILSVTYVPMAASVFLSRSPHNRRTLADRIMDGIRRVYRPALSWALRRRGLVVGLAFAAFLGALGLFGRLGGEFIPSLEEGDLAMQLTVPPGSSLSQSIAVSTRAEQILLANFPEVEQVISKIGTAEVPTDPMSVEDADVMIIMAPKDQWVSASDREALVAQMKAALAPLEAEGAAFEFTQPIELRFNELLTGAKSDVAVKIYGEDLAVLAETGEAAAALIEGIPGAADVRVARTEGFPQIVVQLRRAQLARYGLSVAEVNQVLHAAFAGGVAGTVFEGERRFDLVVRLDRDYRRRIDDLRSLYLSDPQGNPVPLTEVADIRYQEGPMQISRDDTRRQVTVGVNVRNRDVESLVGDIRQALDAKLDLPPGYAIRYGGEFEQLESAQARLGIAVPVVLLLIFALLFFTFHSIRQALMIYTAIPLSAIGGVLALWLRDMPFSISAGVGFIALFGVAVLNGIVLIAYFNQLKEEGYGLQERIQHGASVRLRPVLMTASVASLGFIPMATSTTAGAEVQRPLATVVIGGLITATLLTLLVLPALYSLLEGWAERREAKRARKPSHPPQLKATAVMLLTLAMGGPLLAQDTLDLAAARDRLLSQQPSLQQARYGLAQAESQRRGAVQLGMTSFDYQQGQINEEVSDYFFTVEQDLGQPLAIAPRHRMGEQQVQVQTQALSLAAHQLLQQLEEVYQHWHYLHARLALQDSLIDTYRRFAEVAETRFAAGADDQLGTVSAQSQYELLRLQRVDLLAERQRVLQRFRQLIFAEGEVWPQHESLRPLRRDAGGEAPHLPHPALQRQAATVAWQAAQVRLSRAELTPALRAGYWRQSLGRISGFDGWQVGISVPLADAQRWLAPQQAQLAQAAARSELTRLESELAREREALQAQLAAQQQRLAYFEATGLRQAETLAHAARIRYESGAIDYLAYARLLREAFDLREAHLRTLFSFNQTTIRLRYLAGSSDNPYQR